MQKINFITVCTEKYPIYYAEKITKQFQRKTHLDINYFCITDRPDQIGSWAEPLKLPLLTRGWWNKINLYSHDMPNGWLLYLDLDIVIIDNFDREILWVIEQNHDIACVRDAIDWLGNKYSSSLLIMKTGTQHALFDEFKTNQDKLINFKGGDQVWAGAKIKNPLFIDKQYPNLKLHFKFQLSHITENQFIPPSILPNKDIKMIDCGGQPKPHELAKFEYIRQNWHDI